MEELSIEEFWSNLTGSKDMNEYQRADYIFDTVDDHLLAFEFKWVNDLFQLMSERMNLEFLRNNRTFALCFLTVTPKNDSNIPERDTFAQLYYQVLSKSSYGPERTDRLMRGLL